MSFLKIFPLSDLHLEFYKSGQELFQKLAPRLPQADVLVLAGDIGFAQTTSSIFPRVDHRQNLIGLLRSFKTLYPDVVMICGNHEYYNTSNFDREACRNDVASACEEARVHFLEKSTTTIKGVEFIGTTLWSKVDEKTSRAMNDFHHACFRSRKDYLKEYLGSFRWLQARLQQPLTGPRVVITHHLPSFQLIHPRYADSPINSGFATDIVDQMNFENLPLWICGHTHMKAVVPYKNGKLVVNPVGYPDERFVEAFSQEVFEIPVKRDEHAI